MISVVAGEKLEKVAEAPEDAGLLVVGEEVEEAAEGPELVPPEAIVLLDLKPEGRVMPCWLAQFAGSSPCEYAGN